MRLCHSFSVTFSRLGVSITFFDEYTTAFMKGTEYVTGFRQSDA